MQSERNGKLKESYLSVKDSYNLMFQQTVIWRWWVLQNIYLTDSNLLHPTPQGQNQKPNKKNPPKQVQNTTETCNCKKKKKGIKTLLVLTTVTES